MPEKYTSKKEFLEDLESALERYEREEKKEWAKPTPREIADVGWKLSDSFLDSILPTELIGKRFRNIVLGVGLAGLLLAVAGIPVHLYNAGTNQKKVDIITQDVESSTAEPVQIPASEYNALTKILEQVKGNPLQFYQQDKLRIKQGHVYGLDLRNNNLTSIPKDIENLSELEWIGLTGNKIDYENDPVLKNLLKNNVKTDIELKNRVDKEQTRQVQEENKTLEHKISLEFKDSHDDGKEKWLSFLVNGKEVKSNYTGVKWGGFEYEPLYTGRLNNNINFEVQVDDGVVYVPYRVVCYGDGLKKNPSFEIRSDGRLQAGYHLYKTGMGPFGTGPYQTNSKTEAAYGTSHYLNDYSAIWGFDWLFWFNKKIKISFVKDADSTSKTFPKGTIYIEGY